MAQSVEALPYKAGSIPDDVIGIFHCLIPFGRKMTRGSTQPVTKTEYQEYSLGGKGCRGVEE